MKAITEIGEVLISDGMDDYFFRPSFSAMMSIGTPEDIVNVWAVLNGEIERQLSPLVTAAAAMALSVTPFQREAYREITGKVAPVSWLLEALRKPAFLRPVLDAALTVVNACCSRDADGIVGYWRPGERRIVYQPGSLPIPHLISLARHMLYHGVIGAVTIEQRGEPKEQVYSSGFSAIEYINAARCHFGLNNSEAAELTMTQFLMMLKAKMPPQKGFTQDEYDAVMDEDERRWLEMVEEEKKKKAH